MAMGADEDEEGRVLKKIRPLKGFGGMRAVEDLLGRSLCSIQIGNLLCRSLARFCQKGPLSGR